ncbi:hypothetical protein QN277_019556 [Acacia crassicarpa]|uniref:Disease resistance protein Roq1-like winged-helix domain-containing protein n=1 Tax=Acacia crassicarpa TaxID=499986 RepID=A0AAE1JHX2_9FABA|nr:hypothetical protein QN277_019556 [Acacia crassicarpa]
MHPHPQIQNVLKICLDRLDDIESDVFLDIAFLYRGEDKDHVMSLLDSNYLFSACGVKGLLDKALISISNDNIIQMLDLIQEMGWEIVRQECKENPGKCNRLKDLKNNKGTDAIQCIVLYASLFKDVQFNVDALKNMTNLRAIKFYSSWNVRSYNVHHPTSIESFYDKVRRLKWDGYPSRLLSSSFDPKERVEHSMPNIDIKKHWKLLQDYDISRSLDLSQPSVELPVVSKAQKIEWEDIRCRESYSHVNPCNLSVSMIFALNLVRTKDSKTLNSEDNFRSLSRNYDLNFSCSVKEFPLSSKDISDPRSVTSPILM